MSGDGAGGCASSALRIVLSLLGGGAAYALWMVAAIPAAHAGDSAWGVPLWLLAPVVTAAGFTAGMLLGERLTGSPGRGFLRTCPWPLAGCVAGALAVYWLGPMLIVFGMFVLGTLAVLLMETRARRRSTGSGSSDAPHEGG